MSQTIDLTTQTESEKSTEEIKPKVDVEQQGGRDTAGSAPVFEQSKVSLEFEAWYVLT